MSDTRRETDSIGEIDVPAQHYWGAQTQRSISNFPFADKERMPLEIIYGLVHVKRAAAFVHKDSGAIAPEKADAIVEATDAILAGNYDDEFPLSIWQTGSGTQSNMNVNEVIAGIANEKLAGTRGGKSPVHPNDDVNKGQSSNDSFPTALHIASALMARDRLLPALDRLQKALADKAEAWGDIVKIGRTHLQDATPITLGQEFSGYAHQLDRCKSRIETAVTQEMGYLAQGGTAVGTGLNAPKGFGAAIAEQISRKTGFAFSAAPNPFEALASNDPLVHLSSTLATLAVALTKIANDIRLLGSGPRSGLGELSLPANEPGSSIMPGKVNPTQCEMLTMVAGQVIGNHQAVTVGGMQGHLELNVFKPMIGANVLRSLDLLSTGMATFAERCVDGLEPNREQLADLLDRSLMLVTALAPEIGYDNAAKIAKYAHTKNMTLRAAALELGLVEADTFDRVVVAKNMLG